MKILIDTNVIIDFALTRQPFAQDAENILLLCKDKKSDGFMAAHSVVNFFYILRKQMSFEERKEFLKSVSEFIEIIGIDKYKIQNALNDKFFIDFEDCLQAECALSCGADYIVTRNIKDFVNSSVPAILPEDFLKLI